MSETPINEQPPAPPNSKPNRRSGEEDRAWAQLYASVGQAATAEEVVRQLDADTQARHDHLALYLRARTTLRERKAVEARHQRIGAFVRSVVALVLIGPVRLLRSLLSSGGEVAVEMLPPARRDPAKVRVRSMTGDPEFTRAAERFAASAEVAAQTAAQPEASRGAKAA